MLHDEHLIQRPFAVVTNASESFGKALVEMFASKGFDLIITGQSERELHALKSEMSRYEVFVEGHALDMTTYQGVERLVNAIRDFGHPLDALTFIAGKGPEGPFLDTDLKDEINIIRQNVLAPAHLLKRTIQDMMERGHGKVLVISDLGPPAEAPFEAVYGATRSFLFSFTEAIRSEIKNEGVTITTMLPNLYDLPSESEMRLTEDAGEMARECFDALMSGRDYVFEANLRSKIQGMFSRLLPDKARAFISPPPG